MHCLCHDCSSNSPAGFFLAPRSLVDYPPYPQIRKGQNHEYTCFGLVARQHSVKVAELDLQAVCQLDAAAGLDGLQASGLATSPIPGARPAEAHDLLFCEVGPPLRLYGS